MRKRLEIMSVSHFKKDVVPKNFVSDSRAPIGALPQGPGRLSVALAAGGTGGCAPPKMKILTTNYPLCLLFPNDILKSWRNYNYVSLI